MMAEDSPISTPRTSRHGHDQNKPKLQRDIDKGYNQFSPIVEIIRLLKLDNNLTGRLIVDFIKFRDIIAHKGVPNIIFHQMMCAFVMFCRKILGFDQVSHEPKSTEHMSKMFARMVDINFAVCADWFLNILEKGTVRKENIARLLNKMVQNSSFSGFKFIVDENSDAIRVSKQGEKKLEERSFDRKWLDEITTEVQNLSVTYDADEINEFVQCYRNAKECM